MMLAGQSEAVVEKVKRIAEFAGGGILDAHRRRHGWERGVFVELSGFERERNQQDQPGDPRQAAGDSVGYWCPA
jgi:hypothetical protein